MPRASLFDCLPTTHPFPRALARASLHQVQETGRKGLFQEERTRQEPEVRWKCQPYPPHLQSPLNPAAFSLTLRISGSFILTSCPRPHPSFTGPSITRPHFSTFSPSLPLRSAPCCVSECYGEPRDRTRFILVKKYLRQRVPQQQVSMARHLDTGKYGIKE